MFWRRYTFIGVVMLVVGLVLGYGISVWTHHQHRNRVASKHYRAFDHNQQAQPTIAANQNQNQSHIQKQWDPFADMERMRQDIDAAIQRATRQLRVGTANIPGWNDAAGFSSALDVRDRGDHYEVRADLPNTDQKNVKVTTQGDRELRVDVSQHQEENQNTNGGQSTFTEFGSYDQLVTLPGPADMKDMKVDNRNGELIITIPKAKAS